MNHKHLSIAITHSSEKSKKKKEQDYQSMKLLEYENYFSNSHSVKNKYGELAHYLFMKEL